MSITCKSDDPVTVDPPIFDPLVPTIDAFIAKRGSTEITDNIVFSGEDINLEVTATSHAWPVSCGLTEEDTVTGNLYFTYDSFPPADVDAPGLFSSKIPGQNTAVWRVPNLDAYDTGEGLIYNLKVTVFDECLEKANIGSLVLRVFANEGPPVVTEETIQSSINAPAPVTEILDQNGYFEVEQGDECRITLTAASRTLPEICANRGVEEGEELTYVWTSTNQAINLSFDQDPALAVSADFDISKGINVADTFKIECFITDQCTGEQTLVEYWFIVVGAPDIISFTGTADDINMPYDPYFDNYPVLHGNEIILTVIVNVKHPGLCDMKGISPDLAWVWEETSNSVPSLVPDYYPLPNPNHESSIEFVIPAALNGTEYSFDCNITDQCNGLTDSQSVDILVIVPPEGEIGWVEKSPGGVVTLSPETGRYDVDTGDMVTIRIRGTVFSDTTFCAARGINDVPPLRYSWDNPWPDEIVFNYNPQPILTYSDMTIVVPDINQSLDIDLRCTLTDICNELYTDVIVPLTINVSGE